jgi:hypothetical protein
MQGRAKLTKTLEAGPMVPPFAVPTWVRPVIGAAGDSSVPIAAGWATAHHFDVVTRNTDDHYQITRMSEDAVIEQADDRNKAAAWLDQLYAARAEFAGLDMSKPHLMGVINTTPDSFSDGGAHLAPGESDGQRHGDVAGRRIDY